MSKNNFIVVSNRLPVTVSKENGKLSFSPSSGGLATAMSSLKTGEKALWIGWPGINDEELSGSEKKKIVKELEKYNCIPVFLSEDQVENFYEGYSNEGIWPLFHYFQGLAEFDENNWKHYQEVNELFAQIVAKNASSEATIWVHDYHFMLLPKMIRQKLKKASIGFFLHIPFPSFEVFRLLPNRKEILQGLLGADLIGFHIYDYVRHFNSSVARTLGSKTNNGSITHEGRLVKADAFPIGIDYKKFEKAATSTSVKNEIKLLDSHYGNKKLILSVDRMDYSKGIARRLVIFEKFLSENPRYHKKVTLVVIAVPSRTEVRAYQNLRDIIERGISKINGTYATSDWMPVSYQFQNLPFNKLVGLYVRSEIAMVTPLRDGMNLVAKEYLASKQGKPGVLILSELTGAVDELSESLVINPNDTNAGVTAIKQALAMPSAQKRSRLKVMQRRLSIYDIHRWADDFLEQLKVSSKPPVEQNIKIIDSQTQEEIAKNYQNAKKRLIILDYDGTLRVFAKNHDADAVEPKKYVVNLIKNLASNIKNDLYIISGRPKKTLEDWFGETEANLVAEHGFWMKEKGSWKRQKSDNMNFKDAARRIMEKYEERTPGAEIEEKHSSLVWHFRKVTPELAYVRSIGLSHDLRDALAGSSASVYNGNKIVEVKPRHINKGSIVENLAARTGYNFIICCGDDYTDEDMFRALAKYNGAYSVKVGTGETVARHQVKEVEDVLEILRLLQKA